VAFAVGIEGMGNADEGLLLPQPGDDFPRWQSGRDFFLDINSQQFALSGHDFFTDDHTQGIDFFAVQSTFDSIMVGDHYALDPFPLARVEQFFGLYQAVFRVNRVTVEFGSKIIW